MTDSSTNRFPVLPDLLLLLAAVLLVFAPTLFNGFVHDDHPLIERNPVVRTLSPAKHLLADFWASRDPSHAYYRPAVTWSLAMNRAIHGTAPWGYHLLNVLIHAGSAVLLFLFLRRLSDRPVAWLGAAIFALHPVQVESVAWVMGRTDLLACFFVLLGLWIYSGLPDRLTTQDTPRLLGALVAGLAAMLSKENAVVFPAVLVAADLARYRAEGQGWTRAVRNTGNRLLRVGLLYVALLAGYLILRSIVTGNWIGPDESDRYGGLNPLIGAAPGIRWLTAVVVAGRYAALIVFPLRLSIDYQIDVVVLVESLAAWEFLLALLGIALLASFTILIVRSRASGLFGALVAVCAYLPVSHLFFVVPYIMAERYLYLPMLGIATLVAAGLVLVIERFAAGPRRRRLVLIGVMVLIATLGTRTFRRTLDWRDDFTLFSAAVRATPRSVHVLHGLGFIHSSRGEVEQALESYDRALSIHPGYLPARLNRAAALRKLGHLDEAERSVRGIEADHPGYDQAAHELIEVLTARSAELEARGDQEAAAGMREEIVATALAAAERTAAAEAGVKAVFLGKAAESLVVLGRDGEAERTFRRAIEEADHEFAEGESLVESAQGVRAVVHSTAAEFYRGRSRWADAARSYETAAEALAAAGQTETASRMKSNAAEALRRAAEAAMADGQAETAISFYDRLIDMQPSSVRARHARARARIAAGDSHGAEADLQSLLDTSMNERQAAAVWTDLAVSSAIRQEWERAIERLDRALEIDSAHTEARYRRGLYGLQAGRAASAEADLVAALDAGLPARAESEAWFHLGRLSAGRGDSALATERLMRCLDIRPDHGEARALLRGLRQE